MKAHHFLRAALLTGLCWTMCLYVIIGTVEGGAVWLVYAGEHPGYDWMPWAWLITGLVLSILLALLTIIIPIRMAVKIGRAVSHSSGGSA